MTTYISIAGKYCVLMANTPNKGGVSKKVDNFRDRKILKAILNDVNVGNDRSVIIRTAGVGKRPEDIKRDCEYLNKLWDSIKEIANKSAAPSFIHAEDDVIKRCIRDVYDDQVGEVIVEGAAAFEMVNDLVKLTISNSASNIKFHDERTPIFNKYRVEQQIAELYEKQISLPSGGSIVIDHTEALVAVDVNSGRATKESGVEETAFNTNMEAVKQLARQLRLRDLAGLVVIDFIDMYDQKHRRAVERTLRDELQKDRARIQLGRISVFGLLEMSRQRLGASFFETITEPCKHCNGTGYVRSVEILAVSILRSIRHACADKQAGVIYVYTDAETISYMMNYKKNEIISTEKNYEIYIFMHSSDDVGSQGFNIKKRKNLSDEEKREIEMQTTTGKVNQLGLEKSYFENYSRDEDEEDACDKNRKRQRDDKDVRRGKNRYNNRDKRKNGRVDEKKSFFKSLFFFGK
jgi:ribonuclease E